MCLFDKIGQLFQDRPADVEDTVSIAHSSYGSFSREQKQKQDEALKVPVLGSVTASGC